MCLRPFGLYCSACLGILLVSILCMCCSHFSWYCFISFTIFSAPVFSLIHWFFSLPSFVIPRRCLKNFMCAASKCCSSLFFSTQASLPNFNAALAVMLSSVDQHGNFHSRTVHLDIIKVLLPTDAQENCFKRSIKIYSSNMFQCNHHHQGAHYVSRFRTVRQTYTSKDLITYAATPPD